MAGRLRNVVAGLTMLPALLLAAACGNGSADTVQESAQGYRSELRAEFVADCTATGIARAVCVCWYEALEKQVPFERFEQLDEELRSGSEAVPPDVEDLAVACAAQSTD